MEATTNREVETEEFKVKFEEYLNGLIHTSARVFSIVAAFLIPVFIVLDYFIVPRDLIGWFAVYRFTVTPLMILQFLVIRYTKPGPKSLLHAYFASYVIAGMIILMTVALGGFDSSYYAGLNLVLIAANLMIPLKPVHLFINSTIIIIGYAVSNLVWGGPFLVINFINNLYFLSSTIVITLAISYLRFNLLKQEFSLKLKVAQSKEKELKILTDQLLEAKSETDNILDNVKEGIFLLNSEYKISSQYSRALEAIFESREIGGQSFIKLIQKMIRKEEIPPVMDFFDLLFSRSIQEKRLTKLNPLSEVFLEMESNGEKVKKYLKFDFKRIGLPESFSQILTTVQDITAEKALTKKIEETAQNAQEQMQLLFHIIQIRPAILEEFITETNREMMVIEEQLKSAKFSPNLIEIIQTIFRSIHTIKGNAGLLQLDTFVTFAHRFEEKLKELHNKNNLTSLDLLGLLYLIVELKRPLNMIGELIYKIKSFQNSTAPESFYNQDLFITHINSLVQRIATRDSRKVKVVMDNFFLPPGINSQVTTLKNIIVQIIRNAIVHGIEPVEERAAAGKPDEAVIELKSKTAGNHFEISIKDDGRGLQLEKIKQTAVSLKKYTEEEVASLSDTQVALLIYDSGMTTRQEATLDAGRGIGLNIVKFEVEKMGGHIKLKFAPRQYTEFCIVLPHQSAAGE